MKQMLGLVGLLSILAVGCASAGFDYSTSNDDSSASAAPAASTSIAPRASSEGEGQTVTNSTPSTTSSASENTPSSSSSYDGPMAALVELAMVELSNRMNVALSDITVVSTESMVWPNGALGCPQPDMSYTQALVDGALIVLSAEGRTFNYHSGGNHDPFLCTPTKTVPGQTSTTLANNASGGEDN